MSFPPTTSFWGEEFAPTKIACEKCGSTIVSDDWMWDCPVCCEKPEDADLEIWARAYCFYCEEPILLLSCAHWYHKGEPEMEGSLLCKGEEDGLHLAYPAAPLGGW